LTELADLNVSYIGFIERGKNLPTLSIVLDLADALGVEAAVDPGRRAAKIVGWGKA
jgi:transcriptional regulator with XRE-family HTH domain